MLMLNQWVNNGGQGIACEETKWCFHNDCNEKNSAWHKV